MRRSVFALSARRATAVTGMEMGASLGYAAPGLAVAARLGGIARSDDRDEEWRASFSAHHDTAVSGLGFSVSPSWDVEWGGTAGPEHRIGVRVRLPLGPAATAAHR